MNIIQLQYLITAATYGSFTKAASIHHMTVPTISQSIKQLEGELDTAIFHRTKKGIVATKEGELILQHAASILRSVDMMKHELSQLKEEYCENIIISTIPGLVPLVVQATIEFAQKYPLLNVQMIEGDTQTVMNHVNEGYASMGFLSYSSNQQQDNSLEWLSIIKGKAALIVSKNSSLCVLNTISAEDIKNEVFVLYKDEDVEQLAQQFLDEQPSNRIALSTNNIEAIYQMVVRGNTITIAPDFITKFLRETDQEQLVTIPLQKYQTEDVILGRITRKNEQPSRMINEFTARLMELCKVGGSKIENFISI
ncbi:DNA-binding transcriptional LysR family regulator [Paenibacillus turicensis]|uniref:DNA-binding transcriptional LysR family regulator n=1 Tax=Paenibacillus turicensis TaxID=160487 RepID=A0ABS4FRH9_9BACL|nr:LysR family transcriptional regulator [Paenibacillus turicensis]MBP1905183.1 DNA-binding transcriptional LysR family regulator [Paenibacillus turicensis]